MAQVMTDQHATLSPPRASVPSQRNGEKGGLLATAGVAAALIGWLLALFVLSAATTDVNRLAEGVPLEVGSGVYIRPEAGWRAASEGEAADQEVALQKSGTQLTLEVGGFWGTSSELLELRLGQIQEEVEVFRPLPPRDVVMGGHAGGVAVTFSATTGNVLLDGEVAVLVRGELGVIATSVATAGDLQSTQAEVERMLSGMEIP